MDPLIRSVQRYSEALKLLGGKVQRRVMVCDRCNKESKGEFISRPHYWAEFKQNIPGSFSGRKFDICDDCVKDFDEFMKNVDLVSTIRDKLDLDDRRRQV